MSSTLLDHLRSVFTPSAVSELARSLSESTASTQKALDGLLPTLTAGVINRASEPQGATQLDQLLRETPFAQDPTMSQLVTTANHRQKAAESGNALIKQLFADHPNRLAEATAGQSGVTLGSAITLTGLVMSVLMGYLHRLVTTQGLTSSALTALLLGEREAVQSAIPAGYVGLLGGLAGLAGVTGNRPLRTEPVPPALTEDRSAGVAWLPWLLGLLILLALLFFLLRGCNQEKSVSTVESTTGSASDTIASDLDGNGPPVRVGIDLPGGRQLSVVEHSFNDSLARYLAGKNSQTPRMFTFDNLTFDTDSARITEQARPEVDALIQIMQAYPNLQIRIEGNTDSTGDDAINDPLSGERADTVRQALIQGGIASSRVTTRERGDRKPVASNQTAAGRQMNRRIDVVITKL